MASYLFSFHFQFIVDSLIALGVGFPVRSSWGVCLLFPPLSPTLGEIFVHLWLVVGGLYDSLG